VDTNHADLLRIPGAGTVMIREVKAALGSRGLALTVLRRAGIATVADLVVMTPDELRALPGIGPTTYAQEFQQVMADLRVMPLEEKVAMMKEPGILDDQGDLDPRYRQGGTSPRSVPPAAKEP